MLAYLTLVFASWLLEAIKKSIGFFDARMTEVLILNKISV